MKPSDIYKQLPIPDPMGANSEQSETGVDEKPLPEPIEAEAWHTSGCGQAQGSPTVTVGIRSPPPRLATVNQVAEMAEYRCFPKSSLRHLIFQAEPRVNSLGEEIPGNGLASAIIRIGRRVLIDLDVFDRWIESHREAS